MAADSSDVGTVRSRLGAADVLILASGLWFLAKLLRYAFPPLFEPLQAVYPVSTTELGLAFTGFMLCYAAMQFPAGVLGDRIGHVQVMVTGALVAAVAAIALYVEAGFALLVVAMLVIGAGTGLHKTVSVTLLAIVYPSRTGRAIGIHDTVGTAAGVIAPLAAIGVLERAGWRPFFVFVGLLGLVVAGLAAIRIPRRLEARSPSSSTDKQPSLRGYLGYLARPSFAIFTLVTILVAFTYNGVIAFLPLYLAHVVDLSVGTAGLLYSVLFAATVVQLVTGELSDRIGRAGVLAGCVALGFTGLLGVLLLDHVIVVGLAVLVFGIGSHGFRPVRDAFVMQLLPDGARGGGLGIVRTLLMAAGALAPAAVGVVADTVGFRSAFGMLGASLGIALIGSLLVVLDARR